MFLFEYFGLPYPTATLLTTNTTFCALGTNSNVEFSD